MYTNALGTTFVHDETSSDYRVWTYNKPWHALQGCPRQQLRVNGEKEDRDFWIDNIKIWT